MRFGIDRPEPMMQGQDGMMIAVDSATLDAALSGFLISFGLIAAIGAQNAFVLRQGLRREHVLAVVLFCAISDAVLISAGVSGFALASDALPKVEGWLVWGGIGFLVWFGFKSFRSAWQGGGALSAAGGSAAPLGGVLLTLAALTWLNPHVYLDTVVFLGSISTRYPGREPVFALGAVSASLTFFATLGFGARLLAPLFARPRAWQALDLGVGVTMWAIAASLIPR